MDTSGRIAAVSIVTTSSTSSFPYFRPLYIFQPFKNWNFRIRKLFSLNNYLLFEELKRLKKLSAHNGAQWLISAPDMSHGSIVDPRHLLTQTLQLNPKHEPLNLNRVRGEYHCEGGAGEGVGYLPGIMTCFLFLQCAYTSLMDWKASSRICSARALASLGFHLCLDDGSRLESSKPAKTSQNITGWVPLSGGELWASRVLKALLISDELAVFGSCNVEYSANWIDCDMAPVAGIEECAERCKAVMNQARWT